MIKSVTGAAIVAGALALGPPAAFAKGVNVGTIGNRSSFSPDVSATGRYIAFASDATNLAPGDSNSRRDIFLRDTQNGTTKLVSKGVKGQVSNGASYYPSVSDNGRFVSFTSDASNLVVGDTNRKRDVFRVDLATGKTVRISVAASGAQSNGASDGARMSGDGNLVVFSSLATNLASKDTNRASDVFLRDISANSTRRISIAATGDQFMGDATMPTISSNGALVGFRAPSGGVQGIYRWTRSPGKASLIAEGEVGSPVASNGGVSFGEGEYNEFCPDSYLAISAAPATESFLVTNSDCSGSSDHAYDVSKWGAMSVISYYDYGLDADNLVVIDGNYELQSSLASDATPLKARLSVRAINPSMSGDGSRVAFVALQDGLNQVFVWDWMAGTVSPVSVA